ncbi:translation initiation factor eIF4e [Backusella circina FSU 941]|nr:translation initiation factor eIF4e [Backusella circina FSU 941]
MSYHLGYDLAPTSKFQSERHIFDFNKMMVHIPSNRTSYPYSNKKTKDTPDSNRLETTSITPLDVVTLDTNNVLFISTLDSNWTRQNKSSVMMRRQTSHTPERTKTNYHHHTRRYSQPERNDPIPPPPPAHYYYDKRNSFHNNRRTSVQSDAASSTELIRRFSSESTTSSVVTHLSWVATTIDENNNISQKKAQLDTSNYAQTAIVSDKHQQYQQQQQQQQHSKQENVPFSCTLSTNTTNTTMSPSPPLNKQREHEHPNICDTGHYQQQQHPLAPSIPQQPTVMQQLPLQQSSVAPQPQHEQQQQQQQDQPPPVWADPIKIKENPVRYEYTATYLQERSIPTDSMLPLPKPCVFHFSDSNNKSKSYGAMIKHLFECDTACNFAARWRLFHKRVPQLIANQSLYCFVKGVEPMWEDKVNQNGGRLTLHHAAHLDELFEWLLLSLVGGSLYEQGAVGVVVSRRTRGDRIELWLDASASLATLPDLKNVLCSLLPESCHSAIHESRFKKHF